MVVGRARPLARSRHAAARWLVLAPHADDETIGAGALVAQAAACGTLAGVVYLTDGAGSHVGGGGWLARVRQHEARRAVRRLCAPAGPPVAFLGWPDARPHAPGSPEWIATRRTVATLIRRLRVDAVAVTDRMEPHCDHAALFHLARAAIETVPRAVDLFAYRVWSDPVEPWARRVFRTDMMAPGRRRAALLEHRSQTSARHGAGFRLARAAWRMPAFDLLHWHRP